MTDATPPTGESGKPKRKRKPDPRNAEPAASHPRSATELTGTEALQTRNAERLVLVERAMLRYPSHPAMVEATCSRQMGITKRAVRKLVAHVRAAWRLEAAKGTTAEGRAAARGESIAFLFEVRSRAMQRTRYAFGPDGRPLRDPAGAFVREADPDLKSAVKATEVIARLRGEFLQPEIGTGAGAIDGLLGFVARLVDTAAVSPYLTASAVLVESGEHALPVDATP